MITRGPWTWPGGLLVLVMMTACGGGGSPTTPATPAPGTPGTPVANEGWVHVAEGSTVVYTSNPPASGPHYPVWLRYQEYTQSLPRPYWVHNLEHGAVVFLYRPSASAATVQALTDAYRTLPDDPACGHKRAVLVPDPGLGREWAV